MYKLFSTLILSLFLLGNIYGQGCWKEVSAGNIHTVAIKNDGTLWAWGFNSNGQLGDGTTVNKLTPIQVGTATNWKTIACGDFYTIAIKNDGSLWAWGYNYYGQLGDGTTVNKSTPIQIGTAMDWKTISRGWFYTIAIKNDGSLWAWGRNSYGQLGDGTTVNKLTPIQVGTATNWKTIACGAIYTTAIKNDGSLWAWGSNSYGQLGDGTTVNKLTPIQVGTATNWKIISCGQAHTIAIKNDGSLWAWGSNGGGELGDGTTVNKSTPIQIGTAMDWKTISCGWNHTIAIKNDGSLWAWGINGDGQLGDGTTVPKLTPIQIGTATNWKTIACGQDHTIAIKNDGSLWAWGSNGGGQLGDGTTVSKLTPTLIQCPTTPNPSGLIGYYPFNGNANDESGSNNNGTVQGARLTLDRYGNSGKAYSFNGTSSYIDLGTNINPAIFTISAWAKFDNITNLPAIVSKIANVNGSYFKNFELGFSDNNGTPRCIIPNGSSWTQVGGSTSLGDNKWNHILATYDGTTAKLYINGILNQSASMAYTSSTSSTYIGARPMNDQVSGSPKTDLYFNGKLDDIRIYNRALNATEVSDIYNAEKPPVTQSLPYITLSSTSLSAGQNLTITGKDFSPNYTDTLNIYSFQAQTNIKIPFTTNSLGTFSQSIGINASNKGRHLVSARDTIKNQPITSQMYEVKETVNTSTFNPVLKVVAPSIASTYDLSDNNKLMLKWSDVIYDISKLNPATAISNKQYTIEYKRNNGSWTVANTQTYQTKGVFTSTEYFNYEYTFTQSGNYQFRIKETDNYNNWDTTIVLTVNGFTNSGNMAVSTVWDFSGNRPTTVAPYAICADGTARMYVVLERKNFNELSISKIKATVLDDENIGPNDPKVLGKIMPALELNKYSLEANNANSQSAEYPITKDDKNSHYYFWYVAPDNFTRNSGDNYRGERNVNIKFEVTYSGGSTEIYTKKIAVYRPPLMMVHGWNSDASTWDDFKFDYGTIRMPFYLANDIFKAGIRRNNMLPAANFKTNGGLLILQDDAAVNSFANQIKNARNKGIACNKVDYICHSMGGSMVRTAINWYPDEYNPPANSALLFKNYGKGFTNKIITINTPHNGSSGADLLVNDILPYLSDKHRIKMLTGLTSEFARNTYKASLEVKLIDVLEGLFTRKYKIPVRFDPTEAVSNLQFHNSDPAKGGVRFSETKNVKAFYIASYDENFNTNSISDKLYKEIQEIESGNWGFIKVLMNYAQYSTYGNLLLASQSLNLLNWRLKNKYETDDYFPYSDGVVPLSSQLAQSSNTTTQNYHFTISRPILKSNHISAHNAIPEIGNKTFEVLNEKIESSNFTTSIAANNRAGGIRVRSGDLKPIDSTVEKYNDTTKYRLLNSIASLNYIDSTIAIQINVKDTNKLLANTIVFQGQMYFNKLEKGNLLYLLKVNPNYIDSQLLVTTLTYDSAGYNVHYNMTYPIKIVPQDTLRNLTCEPRLKYLNAKEEYHPTIYANFGKYISNISLNNSDISISIADPNVMSFNGNLLVAKDTGSTYVVVSYRGLKDTTYYVITPPIEIVPEACVPPTVDFSYTTNGKTITLTNKSTNATNYKWKLSNGVILTTTNPTYTFTDTGEYLVCLTSYNACDSTKICQTVRVNDSVFYSIGVASNPSIGGNVTGLGMYSMGQSCSLIAVANQGYQFLNWTENGTIVSTDLNYTFVVNRNRTLVANFKKIGTGILVNESKKWLIYPNPSTTSFYVELQDEKVHNAVLYNALGQKVKEKALKQGKNEIIVSHLAKGVYYLEIENFEGNKVREKIIVE